MALTNNTAKIQAPLEAISWLLLSPPLPPHVHFVLDSQYVLDLLSGISLPPKTSHSGPDNLPMETLRLLSLC